MNATFAKEIARHPKRREQTAFDFFDLIMMSIVTILE